MKMPITGTVLLLLLGWTVLAQAEFKLDKYGGITSLAGTKTGWFHAQEIADRWYFVTPDGHAFFSLGATHAVECLRLDEHNLFETRYESSEGKLADFLLERFRDWGYIDRVHRLTGKPVLLADTNTMTRRPAKEEADPEGYERAAGEHTMTYYLDAAANKYCIGIHRCTVRDYQPWNPQYHRRGLLRADDRPYPILVDYTQRANEKVYELVYPRGK